MMRRLLLFTAVAVLAAGPALADPTPAPSAPAIPIPSLPSGIQNSPYGQAAEQAIEAILRRQRNLARNGAHGTVTYFRGYELQVYTDPAPFNPSHYRNVHLHRGTVINPRGATLRNGMVVDVSGQAQPDGSLNADLITVQ